MSSNAERAIAEFAQSLADLRRACGSPSFPEMERLSTKKAGRNRLPRATASDAIRGKRLPRIEVVIGFVNCCREHAKAAGVEVDPARLDTFAWNERWIAVRALRDEKPRPHPLIKETTATVAAHAEATATLPTEDGVTPPLPTEPTFLNPSLGRPAETTRVPVGGGMWLPGRRRSAYLLLGIGEDFRYRELRPLPWLRQNINNMRQALRTAAPWMRVTTLIDPSRAEVHEVLETVGHSARDLLIVHLVGYGFVDDHMRLRLLTADTDPRRIDSSSLDVASLLESLRSRSPAAAIVLIIDTCFAGRVISSFNVPGGPESHTYVVAATGPDGLAVDAPNSLTGTLARILERGVDDCAYPMLTAAHLARACARSLAADDEPLIANQVVTTWSQGDADKVLLATNLAGSGHAGPAQPLLAVVR